MLSVQAEGRHVALNSKGFLADFAEWTDEVGKALAAEEGLELTDCHWTAIHFLRD